MFVVNAVWFACVVVVVVVVFGVVVVVVVVISLPPYFSVVKFGLGASGFPRWEPLGVGICKLTIKTPVFYFPRPFGIAASIRGFYCKIINLSRLMDTLPMGGLKL